MMHLTVEPIGNGLHPTEIVVAIRSADGRVERLVVPKLTVENGSIEVSWPLRTKGDLFLVELPRETQSGAWRVWVHRSQVQEERMRA